MPKRSPRAETRRRALRDCAATAVFAWGLTSGSTAEAAPAPTLEAPTAPCPGPICIRPASRPYQTLAGFSLVVGSILWMAPRRESSPNPSTGE